MKSFFSDENYDRADRVASLLMPYLLVALLAGLLTIAALVVFILVTLWLQALLG